MPSLPFFIVNIPPHSGQISIPSKSDGLIEVFPPSQSQDSFEYAKLFCLFFGCILRVTLPFLHFGHLNLVEYVSKSILFSISLMILLTLSNLSPESFGTLHLFEQALNGPYLPFLTNIILPHSGQISISSKNSISEL